MLSIGEFSKLSRVSIKTLRYYHEIGLMNPEHIDRSTGYRYYSASQVTQVQRILAFKQMGFSLDEIEALLVQRPSPREISDRLSRKRTELESRIIEELDQIRLIDQAVNQIAATGMMPADTVTVKQIPTQLVASLRDTVRSYDDATALFDELVDYVKRRGVSGTLGAIWHRCGSPVSGPDCEALVVLKKKIPGNKRIAVYELSGTTVVSAIHEGDAGVLASYSSANKWIAASNWKRCGPNREIYLKGGYSEDSSAVMEIQFPVESRESTFGN